MPDPKTLDMAELGEVELGGCVVHEGQPHSRCAVCGVTLLDTGEGLEVQDPPTFLLTWNPEQWPWPEDHHQAVITLTSYEDVVPGRWSTGIRKQGIHFGDYLYLVRQGTERGIVGWATATSEIYEDTHYAEEGRTTTYVDLEWMELYDTEDRLPTEVLKQAVPAVAWDSLMGSGVRPSKEAADDLERAWYDHVQGLLNRRLDWDHIVHSAAELESLIGGDVESHLDFEGDDVWVDESGVDLRIGTRGIGLSFPFSMQELYDLARDVEDEFAEDDD